MASHAPPFICQYVVGTAGGARIHHLDADTRLAGDRCLDADVRGSKRQRGGQNNASGEGSGADIHVTDPPGVNYIVVLRRLREGQTSLMAGLAGLALALI